MCWVQVDAFSNLLYVWGQVLGHKSNSVRIRNAVLKTFKEQPARPVPKVFKSAASELSRRPKEPLRSEVGTSAVVHIGAAV